MKEVVATRDPDEPIIVIDEIGRIESQEVKARLTFYSTPTS
jgi:hypothetical protein